jgi:riboflavin biosynthesis pyrimidine reductase
MSRKADGKIATGQQGEVTIGRPDLRTVLRARWQRADAIDGVQF